MTIEKTSYDRVLDFIDVLDDMPNKPASTYDVLANLIVVLTSHLTYNQIDLLLIENVLENEGDKIECVMRPVLYAIHDEAKGLNK